MSDTQVKQPSIKIHNFSDKLVDTTIHFHVMKMQDSLYLWIGKDYKLGNLAVAMTTKYSSMPAGNVLLSDASNETSLSLSQKLAKRTKKQVFVSSSLPPDSYLVPLVEKRIIEEMMSQGDFF